jgi:hypothetical protein
MTELVFVRRLPVCVVARAQWYVEAGVESITFRPGSFGSDIAGAVLTRLDPSRPVDQALGPSPARQFEHSEDLLGEG